MKKNEEMLRQTIKELNDKLLVANKKVAAYEEGVKETAKVVDLLISQIAVEYGVKVEEEGNTIGYRLEIGIPKTEYRIKSEKRDDKYIIGVML